MHSQARCTQGWVHFLLTQLPKNLQLSHHPLSLSGLPMGSIQIGSSVLMPGMPGRELNNACAVPTNPLTCTQTDEFSL